MGFGTLTKQMSACFQKGASAEMAAAFDELVSDPCVCIMLRRNYHAVPRMFRPTSEQITNKLNVVLQGKPSSFQTVMSRRMERICCRLNTEVHSQHADVREWAGICHFLNSQERLRVIVEILFACVDGEPILEPAANLSMSYLVSECCKHGITIAPA